MCLARLHYHSAVAPLVLSHAGLVHALQQQVVCIMQRTSKKHSCKAKWHDHRFAARLKADHESCFDVMHVYVPHPAKCTKGEKKFVSLGSH